MPLKVLGTGQGVFKGGFLGFQGSGKSYTAALLALAVRRHFKLNGPIGLIETENASEYLWPLIEEFTGQKPVGDRTRQFRDLMDLTLEMEKQNISVCIVDSVTHFWRDLCRNYLDGVNDDRRRKNRAPRQRLEFQDWQFIKDIWNEYTDLYLNSPLHIIVCGRAGYEWDFEEREETSGAKYKELVKTGIKMKAEGEFGYEPSLSVQMELEQQPQPDGSFKQVRTARVLKDRFNEIDGCLFAFAKGQSHAEELANVMQAFLPHLSRLTVGAHSTVRVQRQPMIVNEEGDRDWGEERKLRTIYCEEIQGLLVSQWPGQSAEEKKAKADAIAKLFNTRSWTKVENLQSDVLRNGLAELKVMLDMHDEREPAPKPTNALGIDEQTDNELAPIPKAEAPPVTPASTAAPPPTSTVASTATGPAANAGAAGSGYNPCKFMRLLASEKKVKEAEVLGALKELGRVDKMYWTFEELQTADQKVFNELHESISGLIAKILKAKGQA